MERESVKLHILKSFSVGEYAGSTGDVLSMYDLKLAAQLIEVKSAELYSDYAARKEAAKLQAKEGKPKFPKEPQSAEAEEDEEEDEKEPAVSAAEIPSVDGLDHLFELQNAGVESGAVEVKAEAEEDEEEDEDNELVAFAQGVEAKPEEPDSEDKAKASKGRRGK